MLEESALLQIFPGHVSLAVALVVGRLEVRVRGRARVRIRVRVRVRVRVRLTRRWSP